MNEDGTMARLNDLEKLTAAHGIRIISIAQIVAYRKANETLVKRVAETKLPTQYGEFKAVAYASIIDSDEHVVLVKGDISTNDPVLVRVHSQCLTGDTFGSQRCDCGEQIHRSLEAIQAEGRGVFLYMRQEGRGIGLHNKLRAYQLQDAGLDTVEANEKLGFPADLRWYGIGAQILVDLGIKRIRLLTNNPKKVVGLDGYGLEIMERVPIQIPANKTNRAYLNTKLTKLGHLLDSDLLEIDSQETVSPEI
jgi:3,4-dihydroxy 2-butanone 4-phosphate synthase/GTP cyclohydrolase II